MKRLADKGPYLRVQNAQRKAFKANPREKRIQRIGKVRRMDSAEIYNMLSRHSATIMAYLLGLFDLLIGTLLLRYITRNEGDDINSLRSALLRAETLLILE